jgi:hypothetical protein
MSVLPPRLESLQGSRSGDLIAASFSGKQEEWDSKVPSPYVSGVS